MPTTHAQSRLVTFRVSVDDYTALVTLSNAHRCSLSEFVRTSMHSLVLESQVFLDIVRPGAGASGRQTGQEGDGGKQPILALLVDLQRHSRALEAQVRQLAQALTGRLAVCPAAEAASSRQPPP